MVARLTCHSIQSPKLDVPVLPRNYLARAIRLGFREVLVFGNDRAVLCQDSHRSYVWMLLEPDSAIKSSKDPIRIESPSQDAATTPQLKQQRNEPIMPRRKASEFGVVPPNGSNGTGNGHSTGTVSGAGAGTTNGEHAGDVSLIEQAESVRTSLRDSLDKVGDLIASLKRHRKQSRLVQSTLSSLKQLQSLDA